MNLYYFSQPRKLLKLIGHLMPWVLLSAALLFIAGLYVGIYLSPPDYQQGDSVRIMYIHVPASWFAMMVYGFMALMSMLFFVFRLPIAAYAAAAAAPIGAIYALISLVTGSIWGKPMWGTWWVWDARLTSMLILFLMYIGYIFLIESFEDRERGLKAASILAILGALNLPVVKFSVDWWHTLHQPASVIRMGGPTIHMDMLIPLMIMAGAYFLLFIGLLMMRLQTRLLQLKVETHDAKLSRLRMQL